MADLITATDQAEQFGVSVEEMENWREPYNFPPPTRQALVERNVFQVDRVTVYSRAAVAAWRERILVLAAIVK